MSLGGLDALDRARDAATGTMDAGGELAGVWFFQVYVLISFFLTVYQCSKEIRQCTDGLFLLLLRCSP